MGLVLMEGFDHYPKGLQSYKGWNGFIFRILSPRCGFDGQSIEVIGNNDVTKIFPAPVSEIIVGFGLQLIPNSLWNGNAPVVGLMSNGSTYVAKIETGSGYLVFKDSASRTWVGPALATHSWMYIEARFAVGTSEAFSVHLNGVEVIADTGANFGAADIDRISLRAAVLCPMAFDDIYVLDGSGSAPLDDFLGDVRVKTLRPRADATYTDWTPLTGTDHFAMVDEALIDGDGSYNHDASAGDKDSFYLNPITASVVYAAQLNLGARKGDATLRELAPIIRQGGTDYPGSTFALSTDYLFYSWQLSQDPSGSNWTSSTINADEFGVEVIT